MATQTLQPTCASSNPIVAAYLAARANEAQIDQSDSPSDGFEMRMAQYAARGAREYAIAWGIDSNEHAALVALLAAERLEGLIEGYCTHNDRDQRVVTFGREELFEVKQIKDALVNLWQHLDPRPCQQLRSLALDLGLIDENGHATD